MSRVATPQKSQQSQPSSQATLTHDAIAQRAYEKWMKRGQPHGSAVMDWLEAEKELRAENTRQQSSHSRR